MALATRPKPTVHHRKRRAQHHRKSRLYLKPYLPYLPMLAIVGAGVLVNQLLYNVNLASAGVLTAGSPLGATRIQALAGQTVWALPVVLLVTIAAAVIFAVSHWYRFRRVISRGGTFFFRHSWFDVVIVAVLTAGVILTRSV